MSGYVAEVHCCGGSQFSSVEIHRADKPVLGSQEAGGV